METPKRDLSFLKKVHFKKMKASGAAQLNKLACQAAFIEEKWLNNKKKVR